MSRLASPGTADPARGVCVRLSTRHGHRRVASATVLSGQRYHQNLLLTEQHLTSPVIRRSGPLTDLRAVLEALLPPTPSLVPGPEISPGEPDRLSLVDLAALSSVAENEPETASVGLQQAGLRTQPWWLIPLRESRTAIDLGLEYPTPEGSHQVELAHLAGTCAGWLGMHAEDQHLVVRPVIPAQLSALLDSAVTALVDAGLSTEPAR